MARLPGSARDILRADDVDSVYFQISGPRGELVDGDRELPMPRDDDAERSGRVHFRNDEPARHPVRVAYAWVNLRPARRPQRRARRAWPWCRWPRRWKSAPSSPTRSSRA
jgi:two-component system sensor histidine kinase TctE